MAKLILKRILQMIPTLLIVVTITFCLTRMLPGDPAVAILGIEATDEDIANLFENIGKIEKNHEYTFMEALARLHSNAPAAAPTHDSSVTVNGYRCAFCGATYETRPDVCSVCQAIGSFEPATFQKNV